MTMIGFGSKKRVGKDTAAEYLCRTYAFKHESFAGALKEGIGKEIFGLTTEQMEGNDKEKIIDLYGLSPRDILKRAGKVMRDEFGEETWIYPVYNRITKSYASNFTISDVRFKSEAEWIKRCDGILIRIDRKLPGPVDNHQSEIDLDDWNAWDEVIDNNSSFESLYSQLDTIVKKYILSS